MVKYQNQLGTNPVLMNINFTIGPHTLEKLSGKEIRANAILAATSVIKKAKMDGIWIILYHFMQPIMKNGRGTWIIYRLYANLAIRKKRQRRPVIER